MGITVQDLRREKDERATHVLSVIDPEEELDEEVAAYLRQLLMPPTRFVAAYRDELTNERLVQMLSFDTRHFLAHRNTELDSIAMQAWWGPTRSITLQRMGNLRWDRKLFNAIGELTQKEFARQGVPVKVLINQRCLVLSTDTTDRLVLGRRDSLVKFLKGTRYEDWFNCISQHRYAPKDEYDGCTNEIRGIALVPQRIYDALHNQSKL